MKITSSCWKRSSLWQWKGLLANVSSEREWKTFFSQGNCVRDSGESTCKDSRGRTFLSCFEWERKKSGSRWIIKTEQEERCFSSNFIEQSVQPAGVLICAALSAARCKLVVTTAFIAGVCVCVVDHQSRVGEREREKCEHTKQKSH